MTHTQVASVLNSQFRGDPAFADVTINIEPIPCFPNGCPLGLYYPDIATIVVPPEASNAVLLHELGHRHGHYYYNNLSEHYAEGFRQSHQGSRVAMYMGEDVVSQSSSTISAAMLSSSILALAIIVAASTRR